MTPDKVRLAVDALSMSQAAIAEAIGVSHGHLRNVLNGQSELGRASEILLKRLLA